MANVQFVLLLLGCVPLVVNSGCMWANRIGSDMTDGPLGYWECVRIGEKPFEAVYPGSYVNDVDNLVPFEQSPYHRLLLRADSTMDVFFWSGQFGFSTPGRYSQIGDTLRWRSLDSRVTQAYLLIGKGHLTYASTWESGGSLFIAGCVYQRMSSVPSDFVRTAASTFEGFHFPEDVYRIPRQEHVSDTGFVVYVLEEERGGAYPRPGKTVRLRYQGRIIDPNSRLGLKLEDFPPVAEDTLQFTFGEGAVGAGVEQAVRTMREGGRRVVTLREEVAGGLLDSYPNIPETAIFEFEIWLLDVE